MAETNDGVVYTLRLGEILTGQGESKETQDAKSTVKTKGGEGRSCSSPRPGQLLRRLVLRNLQRRPQQLRLRRKDLVR